MNKCEKCVNKNKHDCFVFQNLLIMQKNYHSETNCELNLCQ